MTDATMIFILIGGLCVMSAVCAVTVVFLVKWIRILIEWEE